MSTFTVKRTLFLGLLAGFLFAGSAFNPSAAMPVAPLDHYDLGIAQSSFMVVDEFGSSGDEMVQLSITSTFSGLMYQYGGNAWTEVLLTQIYPGFFVGSLYVVTGDDHREAVNLKTGSGGNTASMVFYGFDDPLWNSIALNFDPNQSSNLVSATPGDGDHVAPIPIPAALWLFGAGLLGLLGIRRKIS